MVEAAWCGVPGPVACVACAALLTPAPAVAAPVPLLPLQGFLQMDFWEALAKMVANLLLLLLVLAGIAAAIVTVLTYLT